MVYVDSLQLHKLHKQEKKCNTDMNKYGVVAYLDNDVLEFLGGGMVSCLFNDNKDKFDVDIRNRLDGCFGYFLLVHPLE